MESQEVVPIEARAADRWSMVEATMRSVPVVVVKPGKKLVVALLGVLIKAGIGPFAKSSLDKAFGFTVGAWGVGTGEVMAQAEFNHSRVKSVRAIAVTVIGEQATNGDAQSGVVSNGGAQEGDSASGGEVGQDLSEGNTGVVIDGDMDVLPSAVMFPSATSIGARNNCGEASQLLNIEVQQIAGRSMLIANQGHSRLQIAHAVQTEAAENATNGSTAQARRLGNMEAGEALAPQLFDALRQRLSGTTWRAMRSRGVIVQTRRTFQLIAAGPLGGGADANIEGSGGSFQSHPLKKDGLSQLLSTDEGKSCILVNVHSGSPG